MSSIAWYTLFLDTPEQDCCSECGRDLPPYEQTLAESLREEDGHGYGIEAGSGQVIVKYGGYIHRDEAERGIREYSELDHVEDVVMVGVNDTSDSGVAYLIDDDQLVQVDGYEGAMGSDVIGMVSDDHGLRPALPRWT